MNYFRCIIFFAEIVQHVLTALLRVDEDDGLRQRTRVEDVHYEFDLLFWFAFELVLLDVVQLQFLFFLCDRGSILTELVNRVDCLRRVGRAKKHPLELRKLREKFVVQVEQQARVVLII